MFCTNCGAEIADGSKFCIKCGTKVNVSGEENTSEFNEKPNSESGAPTENGKDSTEFVQSSRLGGSTSAVSELASVVGKNQNYYLPEFDRIQRGEKPKFNLAAFFLMPWFLLYRRTWSLFKKYVLPYILAIWVSSFVDLIFIATGHYFTYSIMSISTGVIAIACFIVLIVMAVKMGLNFNRLYLEICREKLQSNRTAEYGVSGGNVVIYFLISFACSVIYTWILLKSSIFGVPFAIFNGMSNLYSSVEPSIDINNSHEDSYDYSYEEDYDVSVPDDNYKEYDNYDNYEDTTKSYDNYEESITIDPSDEIRELIPNFLNSYIYDLNNATYSELGNYVEVNSNMEQSMIKQVESSDLLEELKGYDIVSIDKVNDSNYHATVIEEYDVYNTVSQADYYVKQKCTYNIKKKNDGSWVVSDYVGKIEQLDKVVY